MNRFKIFFGMLICIMVFWGCSSGARSIVVLLPDDEGVVGKVKVTNSKGSVLIKKEYETVSIVNKKKPQSSGVMPTHELNDIFKVAMESEPILPIKLFLNFNIGSVIMVPESEPVIQLILSEIYKRPFPQIIISGHADRKGADHVNYELSVKRARLIKELLISKGIVPKTIKIEAHGESLPLIETADDIPELLNRRVEVLVR